MKKYSFAVFTFLFILISSLSQAQEPSYLELGISGGGPGWMFFPARVGIGYRF